MCSQITAPRIGARRYRALDGYRGLAACLVALFHYNHDFQLGLEGWVSGVSRLHLLVDFFFALSGFVVMASYGDRVGSFRAYATFLRRRIARLYPLHALTLLAAAAIGLAGLAGLARVNHPENFAFSSLPANILMIHAWGVTAHESFNIQSWSISAEWLAYLVFPALAAAAHRWAWPVNLALLAAATLALTLAREAAGLRPWTLATYDFGALRALPSFFAGMMIAAELPRLRASRLSRLATWPAVHGWLCATFAALALGAPNLVVVAMFAALVAGAALAEDNGHPTWLARPLAQRVGAASYAIYMTQVLACLPVLLILRKTAGLGTPAAAAAALATFAAVLAASDLIHKRFEAPCQRWIAGARPAGAAEEPDSQQGQEPQRGQEPRKPEPSIAPGLERA